MILAESNRTVLTQKGLLLLDVHLLVNFFFVSCFYRFDILVFSPHRSGEFVRANLFHVASI